MTEPRILIFDLEITANEGFFWPGRMWETNIIKITNPWYILTFSAKWLNGKCVTRGLPDYPEFKKDKHSDKSLVKELWGLIDKADLIIGHNNDRFDHKKLNTRFLVHRLPPPRPYKTLDTLKIARKHFAFDSNKLNDIGQYTDEGQKLDHNGFSLWEKAMWGDKRAFNKMCRYNRQDVLLDEKVFKRFKPWVKYPKIKTLKD